MRRRATSRSTASRSAGTRAASACRGTPSDSRPGSRSPRGRAFHRRRPNRQADSVEAHSVEHAAIAIPLGGRQIGRGGPCLSGPQRGRGEAGGRRQRRAARRRAARRVSGGNESRHSPLSNVTLPSSMCARRVQGRQPCGHAQSNPAPPPPSGSAHGGSAATVGSATLSMSVGPEAGRPRRRSCARSRASQAAARHHEQQYRADAGPPELKAARSSAEGRFPAPHA